MTLARLSAIGILLRAKIRIEILKDMVSFTRFEDADEVVNRFITLLNTHGISPAVGSAIESEFLSPLQLLESTRNTGQLANSPELLADAAGMYDLAAKILAVETALLHK